MDVNITNNILASLYLLVWILTFIWYQRKDKSVDGGSAVIITYILYGVFSIMSLNDPLFSLSYDPLTLFPYIYLYIMLIIALAPTIYNHIHPANSITDPETRVLKIVAWIIIISAITLVPSIIQNFGSGVIKLFTDIDAGKEAYMEQLEGADDSGSGISNIFAIIYNSLSDIGVFLCFYYMTYGKKHFVLTILLFVTLMIGLLIPVMNGQRGGTIITLLTIIGGYMIFRRYLSKKINHIMQMAGIVIFVAVSLPIAAITMSRFGDKITGVGGYITWYVGQGSLYFNNNALDAGGTRNGDRTFNLAKRVIDPQTPKNYNERRDKYHNLKIDDNIFSTFVGDFTIDFGPVTAFFIFLIFNGYVILKIKPENDKIKVHQLLLLYFTLCVSMQGGMALFSYSDTGNLRIITLFSLYAYLRYHEVLLKKFPLKTSIQYE